MRQATDRARTPPVSCRNRRTISSFDQGVAEDEFLPLLATPQTQNFGRLVGVHHLGHQLANTIVKKQPVGQASAQMATTAEPCGFCDVFKRELQIPGNLLELLDSSPSKNLTIRACSARIPAAAPDTVHGKVMRARTRVSRGSEGVSSRESVAMPSCSRV